MPPVLWFFAFWEVLLLTPDLIPNEVEFTVPKFAQYNPRKDVERSTWFRLQNTWYSHRDYHGLTGAQLVLIPVLLGIYSESSQDYVVVKVTYLRDQLKSKINHIRATLAEIHNRNLIEVRNPLTVRDVPMFTNERTNERTNIGRRNAEAPKEQAAKAASRPKGPSPSLLVSTWNEHRGPLPEVQKLTKAREAKVRVRLSEEPDLAYWERTIKAIAETPFLRGENPRGWKADFDWLIANDNNHVKVSEGKYGGAPPEDDEDPIAKLDARYRAQRSQNAAEF